MAPLWRRRVYMKENKSPQYYRAGYRYPRLDARMHNGDLVQLGSTSHKTWLCVHSYDPSSPDFKVLGQTTDPQLAATFAVERATLQSPVVSIWCIGFKAYLAVRTTDGAVGCLSPTPVAFHFVRIDGQKWWDPSRGSLQDPTSSRFLRMEVPGHDGSGHGAVHMKGTDNSGWQLLTVSLTAGYELVLPLMRGVNLGNWFLLERWMASALFRDEAGAPFADRCAALDEEGLMQRLKPKTRQERMEKHWSTWITEQDIKWLASAGLNTIRVPFGYWMTHPEPPFISGQFVYLERLFRWCEKYSIFIILDFHGLKGSQNGASTSGNCGSCGHKGCGTTKRRFLDLAERARNLAVIANLSAHFGGSPALVGFGIANEVAHCDRYQLMAFYQMAYDVVRLHSPEVLVIVGGVFDPSSYPFQREYFMAKDEHMYFSVFSDGATADQQENIASATRWLTAEPRWPVIVGEWSLEHHSFDLARLPQFEQERWLRDFAKAQLQVYEQRSMGWIYWNYKTDDDASPWNFRAMCEKGILPGCDAASFSYSATDWWNKPKRAYAYFDHEKETGRAQTLPVGPYIFRFSGANACLPNSEPLTEAECRQMPKEFGGALHWPLVVNSSADPEGCFKFQASYYFNQHPTGARRSGRSLLCKLTCTPKYVAGKTGAAGCPAGTLGLSESECRDVLKDFGQKSYGGKLDSPLSPIGCFRFGDSLYFNIHPSGSGKIGGTPYCRHKCTIEYVAAEVGHNACPLGAVELSKSECHGAVGLMGPRVDLLVVSNKDDPRGCFVFERGFYFNEDSSGAPRKDRTVICKWGVSGQMSIIKGSSQYVMGDLGSNRCPSGSWALSAAECRRMPKVFRGTLNSPFIEDLVDDPRGCFSLGPRFYFNIHPIGSPRAGRTPFCKSIHMASLAPTVARAVLTSSRS